MFKKIFLTFSFIFVFFLFFTFTNESKANFDINYDGEVISLPDLPIDERVSEQMLLDFPYIIGYNSSEETFVFFIPREYLTNGIFTFETRPGIITNKLYYKIGDSLTYGRVYGYVLRDNTWTYNPNIDVYINYKTDFDSIVFCNVDIYQYDGREVFFNSTFGFRLNFIEEENFYQVTSTNSISYDRFDSIEAYITNEAGDSYFLNWEYSDVYEEFYIYYFDIYKNGTYIITVKDKEKDEEYEFTIKCTEIDEDAFSLNLHLSTTEKTTEPIYVLSNRYYYEGEYDPLDDFLTNYDIDVSYGYEETYGYAPLPVTGYDEERQMNYCEYQFKIVVNGVYKFRILNFNTQEITYQTFVVDNIGIDNKWGEDIFYDNYNDDGEFDPTPVLFLEYVDTSTVRIRTQPFSFNELIMLQCFTKFEDGDFTQNRNIYSYTSDTGNTIYDDDGVKNNNIELYYFYLDVQVDGNYTFQFYNIELDKYTESSIDVNIREFVIGNIDNIENFTDKMVAWSKLHFGFLVYPFELAINIFGRVTNINFTDPVLVIPELKSPFDGTTFFSGVNFNFNSILDIGVVNTIYNIYLVVVDAILIFLFVSLCKKVFGEVFK